MPSKLSSGSRKGIPVPRDQPNSSRHTDDANAQQAPWRSSLDLVWSYSRSQAFHAENLATSPSFVERHWAGRHLDDFSSVDEHDTDHYSHHDDRDDDDDDYDDNDNSLRADDVDGRSNADAESALSRFDGLDGTGANAWPGQALPPNAVQRTGARDRNGFRASHSRLSVASDSSALRDPFAQEDDPAHKRDGGSPVAVAAAASASATDKAATESTPLLGGARTVDSYASARRRSRMSAQSRFGDSHASIAPGHIEGTSTFLQSWFNTVNALIGIGILALPLAFSYAGWIGGVALFVLCGALTNYTGKVLASIMGRDPSLRTYADIGSYAFGPSARLLVSLLFCLELWAVSTALIILFGDSMAAIFPSVPSTAFKAVGFALVLPTVYLPLKLLSPISVVGIISTLTLVLVVLADGFIKSSPPGSILHPAPTSLAPQWARLPTAFGLIMSGFSSHPVIPSLVRDMQDPRQFARMLNLAYLAAGCIYLTIGMAGYAMFGRDVSGEITSDLARTEGVPAWLNRGAVWMIVVNPLAKFALATRPVQTTIETLLGLDPHSNAPTLALASKQQQERRRRSLPRVDTTTSITASAPSPAAHPTKHRRLLQPLSRLVLTTLIAATAIFFPGFEKVMAFLGAFLAFITCILGPLMANFALNRHELSTKRVVFDTVILGVTASVAAVGTVRTFL
ncbi:hypothetical protein ACQY0O_003648 [Thecaphora frezii]